MKPSSTDTQQVERDIDKGNSEQLADLAALEAAAAEQSAAMQPQQPPGPDLAAELASLVTVAVQTLGPLFPSLPKIYTPEVTASAAGSVAAVCRKHGWLEGGVMGNWGEELACLAIVGPLAFATYQGVRGDLAAREAEAKEKPGAKQLEAHVAHTVTGSKQVTFGTTVPEGVSA